MKASHLLCALALLQVACGGKVVFDQGQGGSGTTGTSVTTVTSTHATVGSTVATTVSTGSGILPSCDTLSFGGIGGFCDPANPGPCIISHSCCGDMQATCINKTWTVTSTPTCAQPCIECGSTLSCDAQSACVVDQLDVGNVYQCMKNPCEGSPLSCTCGQAACANNSLHCAGTMPAATILCDCPTCDLGT